MLNRQILQNIIIQFIHFHSSSATKSVRVTVGLVPISIWQSMSEMWGTHRDINRTQDLLAPRWQCYTLLQCTDFNSIQFSSVWSYSTNSQHIPSQGWDFTDTIGSFDLSDWLNDFRLSQQQKSACIVLLTLQQSLIQSIHAATAERKITFKREKPPAEPGQYYSF